METPKQTQPSAQPASVKPASQPTPTPSAPNAGSATTLPPAPVADSAPAIAPRVRVKEECIILVKAPNGSIHPLVNPPGAVPGCRIFDTSELAILEQTTNTKLSKLPSIVVPIGELL